MTALMPGYGCPGPPRSLTPKENDSSPKSNFLPCSRKPQTMHALTLRPAPAVTQQILIAGDSLV